MNNLKYYTLYTSINNNQREQIKINQITQRPSQYEEKILELQKMKKDLKIQNQELGSRVNLHQKNMKQQQNNIIIKKKRKKKKKTNSISGRQRDSETEYQSKSSSNQNQKRRNSWNDKDQQSQISEDINIQEGEDQIDQCTPEKIQDNNQLDDIIEVSESQNSSLNMRTLSGLAISNRENLSPHKTFTIDEKQKNITNSNSKKNIFSSENQLENNVLNQKKTIKNNILPKLQHLDSKPPKNNTNRLIFNSNQVNKIRHNLPKIKNHSQGRQGSDAKSFSQHTNGFSENLKLTMQNPIDILNAIEKAEYLEELTLNQINQSINIKEDIIETACQDSTNQKDLDTIQFPPSTLTSSNLSDQFSQPDNKISMEINNNNKQYKKINLDGFELLIRYNKYHSESIYLQLNHQKKQTQFNSKIIYKEDIDNVDQFQMDNQKLKQQDNFDTIQVFDSKKKQKETLFLFEYDIENLLNKNLKNILIMNLLQEQCVSHNEKTCLPNIRSQPLQFQSGQKNKFLIVTQIDNFLTFDQIIEEKSYLQKFYSENELLFIFKNVLQNYQKIERLGILHNNININNIVYSEQEYKLWNLYYASDLQQILFVNEIKKYYENLQDYYKPPELFDQDIQQIDMRAIDLYCLGCCFLIIKFLLTDLQRFRDTIITKKLLLLNDTNKSSKIISSLMNDNVQERQSVKTKDLIKEIKDILGNNINKTNEIQLKSPTITSNIDKCIFLDKICFYHESIFQWKSIIEIQQNLIELKKNLFGSQSKEYIISLTFLKKAYFNLKNFKQSNKYNIEYLQLIKNTKTDQDKLQFSQDLYMSGCIKQQLRLYQESLEDFKQSLDLRKDIFLEENYEIVQSYFQIGQIYQELGQDKLAETHILKSISILKSLDREEYLIEYSLILDHLSDFFLSRPTTQNDSKKYLEESYAIKLICLDKNDIKLGQVCYKLAQLYHKNNQLEESMPLLKQSISIYESHQSDPAQIVKLRILFANILIKQSKFQEAKDILIHSVEEIQIYNNQNNFKQTLQNLAQYATLLELACDYGRALIFYQEAYKLSCKQLGTQNVFSKEMLLRINDNQTRQQEQGGQIKFQGFQRKKI